MARVLSSSSVRSLLLFIGGSMGAGMFGLPALFAETGIIWGSILYWGIVAIVLLIHLAYAELQAKAGSKHDLAGIAERSLGRWGWRIAMIVYPISVYGATFIYLLLGSQFLAALAGIAGGPTNPFFWQLILWLCFAFGVRKGIRGVEAVERPVSYFLMAGIALSSVYAFVARGESFPVHVPLTHVSVPLAIGVVFFTTISLPIIAEVMAFDDRRSRIGRRTVLVGGIVVAAIKWLFGIGFAGAAMGGMVEVTDLMRVLPAALQWLLPAVGFFAIAGAAVSVLDSLRLVYHDEFHLRPLYAWLLALLPPFILLFTFTQSLLPVMGFMGSFVAATNALLVCVIALVERVRLGKYVSRAVFYLAAGLCLFTIAHTLLL